VGHEGHDHDDDHDHPHGHGHAHGHAHEHGHSHAVDDHRAHAPAHVSAFVVTCSDSRGAAQDDSGRIARELLEGAGHLLSGARVIPDDAEAIRGALADALAAGARAVIFNGGTGLSRRDVTVETLEPLFERRLPGFGELFRALSFREVGSAAWLSRATAGTYKGMLVFALPGSPHAVRLALEALILPELGHAVRELMR
jgi:molybdopterin adenylyltransferase